jgi:hypothetical protein
MNQLSRIITSSPSGIKFDMNLIKYLLLILPLALIQCDSIQRSKPNEEQSSLVENHSLKDDRFFSKPILIPLGKLTDAQRNDFAKQLESALDETKTKLKKAVMVAEGVDNDVLTLTGDNVTKEECLALAQSEIIKRARTIGFKTFSCQNREPFYLYSTPIK